MDVTQNLTRAELAAIYRKLCPTAVYLADPPEKWFRDVLIRAIRNHLRAGWEV